MPRTKTAATPASLAAGQVDALAARLATAEAAMEAAKAEAAELRQAILETLQGAGLTRHRNCWGLFSVATGRKQVSYTQAIKVLEQQLKNAKAMEETTGAATITRGDNTVRVTWAD